ncbi:Pimeloyl-ACP methyl ester carboxylesterase [Agromyces sp. CF514]|uniref:alpha/beta fold hydrolase n=1 Tax=Agromyces sp. CF514 TaxID=1881031 RepID=UPI0008ECB999|nr:alpha/beta hydrolase [Agromyces sp. CF514]SFR90430.1 Pimeloyl-ACP methyl ester carboxylesterase [Agromyces sp. CF514]
MPTITSSDGVRLNYLESGDTMSRPVVLVAGFKAAATSWRYQVKPLERVGLRVIAFDRRGHGRSEVGPADGHTMRRHGADVRDLLEALDLHDATLVGQSMGANSIWAMLHESPDAAARVRDIVTVDQTPKMLNDVDWPHGFYDYVESNRDTYFATGIPDPGRFPAKAKGLVRIARILRAMELPKGGKPTFTDAELELLHDHAIADWRPAVAAASVPSFFIAGAESEFWPSAHAAASADLNALASSTVIEHDGHAANIEQPAKFNDALLAFLAR